MRQLHRRSIIWGTSYRKADGKEKSSGQAEERSKRGGKNECGRGGGAGGRGVVVENMEQQEEKKRLERVQRKRQKRGFSSA